MSLIAPTTVASTFFVVMLSLQWVMLHASPLHELPIDRQLVGSKAACEKQAAAVCELEPTNGNEVRGTVTFAAMYRGGKCGVRIAARVKGLTKGEHGMHIHTYGDIRRSNGKLAGGHFSSPWGRALPHGLPTSPKRHWGDLGNIVAWGGGHAALSSFDDVIRIPHIVGRSVVIHAARDKGSDFQPSGDSGPRQAHCVIGFANPDLSVF